MSLVFPWYRDLQAALGLGFDGVEQMLALLEDGHAGIAEALTPVWFRGVLPSAALARVAYRLARGINGAVGQGLGRGLAVLPAPAAAPDGSFEVPGRAIAVAALNGAVGDHLEARGNPLAIPMHLRHRGRLLRPGAAGAAEILADVGDHLLLMVHGLCMADVFWHRYGHHHGRFLSRKAGVTPVSVVYNTGRHVSANGADLSALIDDLVRHWPVPLRRLSLLGYSMGGLVTRAAIEAGRRQGASWLSLGAHAIYLGSPHHGAPLERGAHQLQAMAEINPFFASLGRLTRVRSAGITDLRHGNIVEEDWRGNDRFHHAAGRKRRPLPLDPAFRHHAVAGTLGLTPGDMTDRMLGDGLVPIDSAFGRHADAAYDFGLGAADRLLVTQTGHLDLLSSMTVAEAMAKWLKS